MCHLTFLLKFDKQMFSPCFLKKVVQLFNAFLDDFCLHVSFLGSRYLIHKCD